jgi:hypothetical protein
LLKLAELACAGSTPAQAAGLVLLTLLTIVFYLWGSAKSLNREGDNMKMHVTRLVAKLKPLFVAVLMTAHAILASFLGGTPMLA